jgi:hypothetical protein
MGYLDNTSITIDAILTKQGRELLAKGRNQFKITQFAVADDEVDYSLYNPAHPLGSNYYGVAIESMPITEAVPDETQSMKYKLITLPKGTNAIPYVAVDNSSVTLTAGVPITTANVMPRTQFNGTGIPDSTNLNGTLGYTATLLDSTYVTLSAASVVPGLSSSPVMNFAGDSETANSVSVIGLNFIVTPSGKANNIATAKSTKLIITGNETGGRIVIPITINPRPTN